MPLRHTLKDLNEYLFDQLDTLTNDELRGEELESQLKRTQGVVAISKQILDISDKAIRAAKITAEYGGGTGRDLEKIVGIETKK